MADLFTEAFGALSNADFDEVPVDIETFATSEEFLGLPPLSDYQYQMIRAGSQIYKADTLIGIYGEDKGRKRFEQTCNEVVLQLGKGCHAPYTPIFNPDTGNWNALEESKSDGLAVSSDGQAHYATEAFKEGFGQMVRVKTSLGLEEDVYLGHKYLSYTKSRFYHRYRGYKPVFKSVSELSVGDRIAVGVGFDVKDPINIPLEHAELIGYWLGDGMLPSDKLQYINMDFCRDELESIQRYRELCAFIGDSPREFNHPTKNMTIFRHGKYSPAMKLAEKYGLWGMRSKTKCVPDVVWRSDNSVLAAVVSKLWQTDGCVYSKNGLTAEYVSVSHQLARDVQRMLLRLGVPSTIRFRTPKSNFDNASEAGYVTVSSQECMNAFNNVVTLLDHKAFADMDKTGRVYARLDNNVYYDRIVSITDIGDGEFWTRTVPDTGNYVGNGFISANSGKDYCSTIMCAYIAYLLLCLKDPAAYYGKPKGDTIDILNIAVNADQARNVFFVNLKKRITGCRWFDGKYNTTQNSIEFEKGVRIFSGHSEREAFEGLNLMVAVLDEISAFPLESATGNRLANTADATYKMYRASVDSRFPDYGKVIMLSFPRFKDDYIQQRYNAVVAEKEVITRAKILKLDPDLPDETEGNEVKVEWDEDHIIRYKYPKMFALKRPTWEINPIVDINSPAMVRAAAENYEDFLGRFAAMPSDNTDAAFIKNKQAIEDTLILPLNVDNNGTFRDDFQPKPDTKYFMHVDLSKVHDRCSVALAHVEKWQQVRLGETYESIEPMVVVDAIRWWKPDKFKPMDYEDVIQYILAVRQRGFDIKLVSFDRWNSIDTMNSLERHHIKTAQVSVAQKHYDDFLTMLYGSRLLGPNIEEFKEELRQLQWIKNRVDHPRSGYKDITDSFIGAVHNAVEGTPKPIDTEVEIKSLKDVYKENRKQESEYVIKPPKPKQQMPAEFSDYLSRMKLL